MQDGPSGLGLALGLAGVGMDAYGAAQAAKAPQGFIDQPNPSQAMKIMRPQFAQAARVDNSLGTGWIN